MQTTDVLALLAVTSLAGSAAALLAVAVAAPLRRWAGSVCAYRLWWVVPLAMLAVLVPARTVPVGAAAASDAAVRVPDAAAPLEAALGAAPAGNDTGFAVLLLAVWALGTVLVVGRCVRGHLRFVAGLGALRAYGDGLFEADAIDGLPAVVGLRGRIVLPADFATRFTSGERALVLAHERVHVARGDVWWNLLATALCALHWFNPLAWWALRRFRIEQELACDATVLAGTGGCRRSYAEALLKTQMPASAAPLACQWPGTHPLKERITMLALTTPHRFRRRAGGALVAVSAFAFAAMAWAAQPPRVQAGADTPVAPTGSGVHVAYDAGLGTVDIEVVEVPAGELLRRLAEATARTLEVADGVDLSAPVSIRFQAVPLATVEQLIDQELDGARLQTDARTVRVVAASGEPAPGR